MLVTANVAADFDNNMNAQYTLPGGDPASIAKTFGDAYYDYSIAGIVPGVDVNNGGTKSLLDSAFLADNTVNTANIIGAGIASYWRSVTTPGAPAHGGSSVVSVNVILLDITITNAVLSVLTAVEQVNGWLRFHSAVEDAVKTAVFEVTELVAGVPTVFYEGVN